MEKKSNQRSISKNDLIPARNQRSLGKPKNILTSKNTNTLRSTSINPKVNHRDTMQSALHIPASQYLQDIKNENDNKLDYFNTVTKNSYTYFLGRGNNEDLVRRVMKQRSNWIQTKQCSSMFVNFKWQQNQRGYKYDRLIQNKSYKQVVNHFQNHPCLTNKESLFRNLQSYCIKNKLNVFDYIPPTFILNANDDYSSIILNNFLDFYYQYWPEGKKKSQEDLKKIQSDIRKKLRYFFSSLNEKKLIPKINTMDHVFLNSQNGSYLWILKPTFLNRGRGIQVFGDLNVLYRIIAQNIEGYIEKALTSKEQKKEEKKEQKKEEKKEQKKEDKKEEKKQQINQSPIKNSQKKSNTVKLNLPLINQKQKDRKKHNNKTAILEKAEVKIVDPNSYMRMATNLPCIIKTDAFVIQKYLQRPYLINQRKFDIRVWVLVTHEFNCYFFKEGYIRLSSEIYKIDSNNINNQFIHLTNNAVQKFSNGYNSFCQGNQLSFDWFRKYLKQKEPQKSFDKTLKLMKQYITLSLKAAAKKLDPFQRKFTFQIFGYDFILDQNLKPWLIQVNNNPCIQESSALLAMLLPRMIDDAFKLTLDQLFIPIPSSKLSKGMSDVIDENDIKSSYKMSGFRVGGYKDTESMWEFLIRINEQQKKKKKT